MKAHVHTDWKQPSLPSVGYIRAGTTLLSRQEEQKQGHAPHWWASCSALSEPAGSEWCLLMSLLRETRNSKTYRQKASEGRGRLQGDGNDTAT